MKRTIVLLLTLLASIIALGSCGPKEPADDTVDAAEGAIYGNGIKVELVVSANLSKQVHEKLNYITNEIYSNVGYVPSVREDTQQKYAHEIVVGDTSRPITAKANEMLAKKIEAYAMSSNDYSDEEAALEDTMGYAIYAEDGSVAIVWSSSYVFETAIDYFITNFVTGSSLTLEDGYLSTDIVSVTAFLEERGARIQEEQFAALEEQIGGENGSEIVASMRKLYKIYKPEAVSWLANLYDADIGGFYFSNSARNTDGFLPDLESTGGALDFVEKSGMAEMYDNDYSKALPSWMLEQIGEWVKSLQDEDGYFYHPQWPKEYLYERELQTRMTRDRGSAVIILRKLGLSAIYPTAVSLLSGKLSSGRDTVTAVSKVIPTAGMLTQFESVTSFRNYINDLDEEVMEIKDPDDRAYKLYAIGNEFQTTWQQVKKDPEYVTILHEFFKKHQDPNTGTWSSVVTFNATNSLHKIGYIYNALGIKLDYIDKMVVTVIDILSRDVNTYQAETYVEIMNAWASLEHIYSNIRKCSDTPEEELEKLEKVKSIVYDNISKAIDATASQLSGFIQKDGSFGYTRYGSTSVSQGCPSAVAGTAEGDVNGYGGITVSLTDYIAYALDLYEYKVNIFSEKERVEFVRALEDLGTIIKDMDAIADDVTVTFDDGIIPENITVGTSSGKQPIDGASVNVESVDGNNVMRIVAVDGKGAEGKQNHSITIPIELASTQANVSVMEFDLCVYEEGSSQWYSMIQWAMRSNGSLVLYPTIAPTEAGKVVLYDSKGNMTAELGNVDERIKFRFEYFWAEGEYKVYVGDKFKAKGTTLYAASLINKPLTEMTFYTPTSLNANYYIDNLRSYRLFKVYDPNETVQYPKEPDVYDFEGEIKYEQFGAGYNVTTDEGFAALYPEKYKNTGGATAIVRTDEATGNKFLSVYAPARANDERSHSLMMAAPTQMAEKPNVYVFETNLKLNSVSESNVFLQILFKNGGKYGQLNMTVKTDENKKETVYLAGVPIGYFDEWFDLRLEYYLDKGVIRVYNGALYMGEITTFSQSNVDGKSVANLKSISNFSIGTYNDGGSLSFSVDNLALSLVELEYTEKAVDTLPAPNPDPDNFIPEPLPDEEPDTEPDDPGTSVPIIPDVEFPGMEPPMSLPDDITPPSTDLSGDEDMGDWT